MDLMHLQFAFFSPRSAAMRLKKRFLQAQNRSFPPESFQHKQGSFFLLMNNTMDQKLRHVDHHLQFAFFSPRSAAMRLKKGFLQAKNRSFSPESFQHKQGSFFASDE